jgi:hypothetical protein
LVRAVQRLAVELATDPVDDADGDACAPESEGVLA